MSQEMLEAENVSMGYLKGDKGELVVDNKRNGYSQKAVKANSVNLKWIFQETETASLTLKSFQNIKEIYLV